ISVPRFTFASTTPGTRRSARSTRATHEAQVMPPICSRTGSVAASAAASAWTGRVVSALSGAPTRIRDDRCASLTACQGQAPEWQVRRAERGRAARGRARELEAEVGIEPAYAALQAAA